MPTITVLAIGVCALACLYSQFITSVSYQQCLPSISLMVHLRDTLASTGSNLVWIIDTGRKSSKGKTMREVLLDIIEAFPKYDLESAEGINKAIEEMEEKLGEVASFKERSVTSPNRSCISRFAISCVSRLLSKIP